MAETFSAEPNAYQSPGPDENKKKGCGCFAWGCLGVVVLLLVVVIGGGFAVYSVAKSQINAYTEEEPAEVPVIEGTEEELAEIQSRVDSLTQAAEDGQAPPDLVLTADEINKLIAQNEQLKGRVYVTIADGEVTGEISFPLDELELPFSLGKGRYLNATVTLAVSYQNGVLIVTVADATVKGEPLPEEFMQGLAAENLAKDLYSDPEQAEFLRKFESIEVRDNKIILRAKQDLAAEGPATEAPAAGDPPAIELPATEPAEPAGSATE